MFKILTKKCSFEHWNRPGVANRSIASTGWLQSVTWSIAPDFALDSQDT